MKECFFRNAVIFYLFFVAAPSGFAQADQTEFEILYEKWRAAVRANPILTEPMLFKTNTGIQELTEAVVGMRQKRFEMATFLCEKFASQKGISYFDANLIWAVAGINLFHAGSEPTFNQNIGQNIRTQFDRFKRDWLEGDFKDPSEQIARGCEALLGKEKGEVVSPSELREIRRYGVFGIPALVEQVKKGNSKHAFAALLVILGSEDYASYIKDTRARFTTREEKLNKARQAFGRVKAEQKNEQVLAKKISAAFAE